MESKFVRLLLPIVLVSGFMGTSRGGTVQLDLSSLGCPTNLNYNLSSWQTNFDMGVAFTEISHVYINWSGGITAGLFNDPMILGPQPFPLDVGIGTYIGTPPNWRHTDFYGGAATYPSPMPFNESSEFVYGGMSWSELFDGQGDITIEYLELGSSYGSYVSHGSVTLDSATLVVDGTVVPEPGTFSLLCFALPFFRGFSRRKI